jgi:cytochrome P450
VPNVREPRYSISTFPPDLRRYPLVGILPQVVKDPLAILTKVARAGGGAVCLGSYRPGRRVLLISRPEQLKQVLLEKYTLYERGIGGVKLLPIFGYGLGMLEGDLWLQRRRLLQPTFNNNHIHIFVSTMTSATASLLDQWQMAASSGQTIDVMAEVSALIQDILIKTVFGLEMKTGNDSISLRQALRIVIEYTNFLPYASLFPLWAPTSRNRAFRRAIETLDRFINRIIEERRRNSNVGSDLVTLLLNARDADTGVGLNDRQVRDEVKTIFLAGSESTAATLAWTWRLLAHHPEVERRIHAEVSDVLGDRLPTADDLSKLAYMRMAVMESMRLFPPAWLITRSLKAGESDEIDGYQVNDKALLLLSPYVTHRLPDLWENPDAFEPERFTPERASNRPRFAYIPFGGGPRQCIGNNLSLMEIPLILAMTARRFRLRLAPGTRVEPKPAMSLCPRPGLLMKLLARNE